MLLLQETPSGILCKPAIKAYLDDSSADTGWISRNMRNGG